MKEHKLEKMKKMNPITARILIAILICIVIYLGFAFSNWDFNATNWGGLTRGFYAILALAGVGVSTIIDLDD